MKLSALRELPPNTERIVLGIDWSLRLLATRQEGRAWGLLCMDNRESPWMHVPEQGPDQPFMRCLCFRLAADGVKSFELRGVPLTHRMYGHPFKIELLREEEDSIITTNNSRVWSTLYLSVTVGKVQVSLSHGLGAAKRQLAELVGFACTFELEPEEEDHQLTLRAVTFDLTKPWESAL